MIDSPWLRSHGMGEHVGIDTSRFCDSAEGDGPAAKRRNGP